jgi:hypothetical protein
MSTRRGLLYLALLPVVGWAAGFLEGAEPASTPTSPASRTQVANPSTLITNAATLKLLVLELAQNRLTGVGWEGRAKNDWATREQFLAKATRIATPYGIDLKKARMNAANDVISQVRGQESAVDYFVAGTWTDPVEFLDASRLPSVKFRSGKIEMSLKSLSVQFADGTECMVGEKVYVFVRGQWRSTTPSGGAK